MSTRSSSSMHACQSFSRHAGMHLKHTFCSFQHSPHTVFIGMVTNRIKRDVCQGGGMQHQICNLKKPHNSHKPIKISDFSGFIWPGCGRVLCLVPLRTGYASDLGRSGRLASQINHLGAAVTVQHLLLLASMRLSFEPVT